MGTLNPYGAHFLECNWIITAKKIGVNHFQLKLISEMFEMFVLLIHEIHPHSFCFVTCFLFIFTREALPHRGLLHAIFCIAYLRICRGYLPQEIAAGICRGNLPQVFAVAICCQNLPWEFAVAIFRGFFVYTSQSFFVYVSKSCLYGGKPFLYVCKTFWFVRFSLLTVFLLVIVVAVMGHRSILHFV